MIETLKNGFHEVTPENTGEAQATLRGRVLSGEYFLFVAAGAEGLIRWSLLAATLGLRPDETLMYAWHTNLGRVVMVTVPMGGKATRESVGRVLGQLGNVTDHVDEGKCAIFMQNARWAEDFAEQACGTAPILYVQAPNPAY